VRKRLKMMRLSDLLKGDLESEKNQGLAMGSAGSIINHMLRTGSDGVLAFLTFSICTLKCIEIIPKGMDDRRAIQDELLKYLRKKTQETEDRIIAERMREDNV
jgi:hypothetical protein